LIRDARALVSAPHQTPLKEIELTFTIRAEEAFLVIANEMNAMWEKHAPKMRLRLVTRATDDVESLREGKVQLTSARIRMEAPR
jgi:hypothetical protein